MCERYPRDQLMVMTFEDLRHDATATFAAVCRFIDVDDTVVPANVGEVFNPAMRLRSEPLRRFMLRKHAWKRLPFGLARRISTWNRTWKPYPPMDPSRRAELLSLYADENAALASWLGRDLSGWSS